MGKSLQIGLRLEMAFWAWGAKVNEEGLFMKWGGWRITQVNAEAELKEGQRRFEFSFPILIFRTQIFSGFFDRLGSFRLSRLVSWAAIMVVPIVACVGLYLVFSSLFALLLNPGAGEVIREVGPGAYILLPGVNPLLPFLYGWLAIICAVVIHEASHGITARSLGLKVNSSGLLFFLLIPIGAFVDVDEEQLKRSRPKVSSRVLASGVGGNIALAVVCLLCLLMVVNGLKPVVDGVYVYNVSPGMPAEAAGILPGDVIVSVDKVRVNSTRDLRTLLDKKSFGDVVLVTVARGEMWRELFSTNVSLTVAENRTVMGVSVGDLMTWERLRNYQTVSLARLSMYLVPPALAPGLVPFSDALASFYTHWLGPYWHVSANMFYWLWFVNFNVAIFNALPIYPLDGGRIFNIALKNAKGLKQREKLVSGITIAVTAVIILTILMTIIIPFVT